MATKSALFTSRHRARHNDDTNPFSSSPIDNAPKPPPTISLRGAYQRVYQQDVAEARKAMVAREQFAVSREEHRARDRAFAKRHNIHYHDVGGVVIDPTISPDLAAEREVEETFLPADADYAGKAFTGTESTTWAPKAAVTNLELASNYETAQRTAVRATSPTPIVRNRPWGTKAKIGADWLQRNMAITPPRSPDTGKLSNPASPIERPVSPVHRELAARGQSFDPATRAVETTQQSYTSTTAREKYALRRAEMLGGRPLFESRNAQGYFGRGRKDSDSSNFTAEDIEVSRSPRLKIDKAQQPTPPLNDLVPPYGETRLSPPAIERAQTNVPSAEETDVGHGASRRQKSRHQSSQASNPLPNAIPPSDGAQRSSRISEEIVRSSRSRSFNAEETPQRIASAEAQEAKSTRRRRSSSLSSSEVTLALAPDIQTEEIDRRREVTASLKDKTALLKGQAAQKERTTRLEKAEGKTKNPSNDFSSPPISQKAGQKVASPPRDIVTRPYPDKQTVYSSIGELPTGRSQQAIPPKAAQESTVTARQPGNAVYASAFQSDEAKAPFQTAMSGATISTLEADMPMHRSTSLEGLRALLEDAGPTDKSLPTRSLHNNPRTQARHVINTARPASAAEDVQRLIAEMQATNPRMDNVSGDFLALNEKLQTSLASIRESKMSIDNLEAQVKEQTADIKMALPHDVTEYVVLRKPQIWKGPGWLDFSAWAWALILLFLWINLEDLAHTLYGFQPSLGYYEPIDPTRPDWGLALPWVMKRAARGLVSWLQD